MFLKYVESLNIPWCTDFLNARENMLKVSRKNKTRRKRMTKA
jgi:hypothetical protein